MPSGAPLPGPPVQWSLAPGSRPRCPLSPPEATGTVVCPGLALMVLCPPYLIRLTSGPLKGGRAHPQAGGGAGPCSRLAAPLLGLPDRCWLPVKVRISLVGAIADGVFELGLR